MSLDRLIYMVYKKNELNKKRLRFKRWANRPVEGCISKKYAHSMWQLTAREMRTMTAEIRRLRVDLDARLHWAFAQWRVKAITIDTQRIESKLFKRYAADYIAEQILLVKSTNHHQHLCRRN